MRLINVGIILIAIGLEMSVWQEDARAADPVMQKQITESYIRLWNFSNVIKTPIFVSLVGSSGPPQVLTRSMSTGRMGNYHQIPPGPYRLSVKSSGTDLKVFPPTNDLIPTVASSATPSGFLTIILNEDQGVTKTIVVSDALGAGLSSTARRLRVFNFATGQNPMLKLLPDDFVLWTRVPAGLSEHVFNNNPGVKTIGMVSKLTGGREAQQLIEANFNVANAISIVVFFDRYGRLSFQGMEDAKPD